VAQSLYDRIGGDTAVMATVRGFHDRLVADPLLQPFFEGLDMEEQARVHVGFLMMAFGGAERYTGRDLGVAHAPLVQRGLEDRHFDAVLDHIDGALAELEVPAPLRAEVRALLEGTRGRVLGRPGGSLRP
jgi:hemoglobin